MAILHRHHIVPRHAGGTNDKSNIVLCSPKVHAYLHRVRFGKYGDVFDKIAYLALEGQIDLDEAKLQAIREGGNKGRRNRTAEGNRRISEANKGKSLSDEHKRILSETHKGKVLSDETKQKIRQSLKSYSITDEHRKNISEALKGHSRTKGFKHRERECPHCNVVGAGPNMTRYHFDNCKSKEG